MRILVVEDEETIADIIVTKIRALRYEVDTSYDSEDGLYNDLSKFKNMDSR